MQIFLRLHGLNTRFDRLAEGGSASLMALGLRAFVGWQFFKAGIIKISDWPATLDLFRDEYHVPLLPPELAAVMGAGGELVFPVLLLLGLFSRPAALGLFVVNLMAVISYPQLWQFECPAAIQDHMYWGIILLTLATLGPGKLSIDHFLQSKNR